METVRIGISSCLLGHKVRFNGEGKYNTWIVEHLAPHVMLVPVCPELEMGLGAPRETMHLEAVSGEPAKLITFKTRKDLTALAEKTSDQIVTRDMSLDGYILKKESPTCGLERVRVYGKNNIPHKDGVGIYAQKLRENYPELPMIEEGRLSSADQRENFVSRVFAYHRLRALPAKAAEIQKFHQGYKLILMAHSPVHYQTLGRLVGNQAKQSVEQMLVEYKTLFLEAMTKVATRKKWVNVLEHMAGYLKVLVDSKEKKQIHEYIQDYARGEIPLMAPMTLIHHLVKKFSVTYLEEQMVFAPYPKQLALRKEL